MMYFCPRDASLLMVKMYEGGTRFECDWCPYMFPIRGTVTHSLKTKPKPLDDILGGEDAWKNVDKTEAKCPSCTNNTAYFMQIQTRSADEPMTIFYKCTNSTCGHMWKD